MAEQPASFEPDRPDLALVLRTGVTTLLATPVMVYLLLPWMTRRFERWLRG